MDFSLTEEQRIYREMFRDFVTRELEPLAEAIDQKEQPPLDMLRGKAAAQGFFGCLVPEDWGGAGLDALGYGLLLEEVARACLSTATILNVHSALVCKPILEHGTEEQKARYLAALAEGKSFGAYALTEPGVGSDLTQMATTAAQGDEGYLINGVKQWVTNAEMADLFLVFARTSGGITTFVVEADTPGVKIGYREPTLGLRGALINTVYFDDCQVPASNRLGEEGSGLDIASQAADLSRLGVAFMALGSCERALEEGIGYSMQRRQFNMPIAQKQAIQNYIANSYAEIESIRLHAYYAASLSGKPGFPLAVSTAKLIAATASRFVSDKILQVHGGYGYMKDSVIERIYRDVRALSIIEGTSELQRSQIASRVYADHGLTLSLGGVS